MVKKKKLIKIILIMLKLNIIEFNQMIMNYFNKMYINISYFNIINGIFVDYENRDIFNIFIRLVNKKDKDLVELNFIIGLFLE